MMKGEIAIILAYFNGEDYINEQLNSIFGQNEEKFHIYIFDDFSTKKLDKKVLNLNKLYEKKISIIHRKENLGYAKNFLSGLKEIEKDYEYFAFCDQDDIWYKDKLKRAIIKLSNFKTKPALYCSSTEITNKDCSKTLGFSKILKKNVSFANALVQNIAGGNTMVFNKFAKELISINLDEIKLKSHDWWSYLIVTGAGGEIIYDRFPSLKYRQHGKNSIGINRGFSGKYLSIKRIFKGEYKGWINDNLYYLDMKKKYLTHENNIVMETFLKAKTASFFKRLYYLYISGIFRQNLLGNISLYTGIILKKI